MFIIRYADISRHHFFVCVMVDWQLFCDNENFAGWRSDLRTFVCDIFPWNNCIYFVAVVRNLFFTLLDNVVDTTVYAKKYLRLWWSNCDCANVFPCLTYIKWGNCYQIGQLNMVLCLLLASIDYSIKSILLLASIDLCFSKDSTLQLCWFTVCSI